MELSLFIASRLYSRIKAQAETLKIHFIHNKAGNELGIKISGFLRHFLRVLGDGLDLADLGRVCLLYTSDAADD